MKTVYRDPIGRLFDGRALPGLAKAKMTSSNYDVDDDGFHGGRAAAGHYCQSSATMTRRQPRSTRTTQSFTLNGGLWTREAILAMAKGIST
jgi:hypothetical protein